MLRFGIQHSSGKFDVIPRMSLHPQRQLMIVKIHMDTVVASCGSSIDSIDPWKHRVRSGSRSIQSMGSIISASAGGIVTVGGRIILKY
jgi:hypothetical protein